ncbi:unnamed protein product [Pleuronectes platessa]|uniref:Uncharacterized protein n=1 Tax=Pleuronectes platessa TaxID=8262 RepID=A0A9N7UKS4_PLEPL|nr:unnamed protein product [Pleuronectes platessa]
MAVLDHPVTQNVLTHCAPKPVWKPAYTRRKLDQQNSPISIGTPDLNPGEASLHPTHLRGVLPGAPPLGQEPGGPLLWLSPPTSVKANQSGFLGLEGKNTQSPLRKQSRSSSVHDLLKKALLLRVICRGEDLPTLLLLLLLRTAWSFLQI